jgi:branched-chain amino acid aminotransferase
MSPCYIKRLTPDGLMAVDYRADSLADAVRYEPEGIYTITNTYNTFDTLKLDSHLDRMEDSARREGIPLALDRARLRAGLRQMIAEAGFGDVRFRISVPRSQPDQFFISLEPFNPPPPEAYQLGVCCATVAGIARRNPAAKTSDWMHNRSHTSLPSGVYEGLLVGPEGAILEGFGSNFYAVLAGKLRTAAQGVLPGIAQQIVLDVVQGVLPVRHEPVTLADLPFLAEAFISSSSRGIVPVVMIDDLRIGSGLPGPYTIQLRQLYLAWVQNHLEPL